MKASAIDVMKPGIVLPSKNEVSAITLFTNKLSSDFPFEVLEIY